MLTVHTALQHVPAPPISTLIILAWKHPHVALAAMRYTSQLLIAIVFVTFVQPAHTKGLNHLLGQHVQPVALLPFRMKWDKAPAKLVAWASSYPARPLSRLAPPAHTV